MASKPSYEDLQKQVEALESEKALLEAFQSAADIVKSIPSGLFIYQYEEPDRLILIYGNPSAEQLTSITVADWIGKGVNEIWPQAEASGITRSFINAARSGEAFETEYLHDQDNRLQGAYRVRAFSMSGMRLGVAFEEISEQKKNRRSPKRE